VCLFVTILFLGPRAGILVYWLGWPAAWNEAYAHFWVPLIGFIAFPWTTLMYAIVAPNGVAGWDYLWIILAVFIDIASLASQGGAGRARTATTGSVARPG
jgi:hypothetical protein